MVFTQSTDHQTTGMDDRQQTRAVGDQQLQVGTELPEWPEGSTRGLSSSTGVSSADVDIALPALPSSFRASCIETYFEQSRRKHNLFTLRKYADARKLRERNAEEILTIGRTELKLPKDLAILITEDRKVLNEEQEFRMHHKHAEVVQDLATQ